MKDYSLDTLSQLARKGLRYTPISRESVKRNTKLQFPLVCFPSCVFQLTGTANILRDVENLDHATYAASGALSMLEKLARFADVKQDGQHVPPVITVTCSGQNITVWLAFFESVDGQRRDHVSCPSFLSLLEESDTSQVGAAYLERLCHQYMGCYPILPYYRQHCLLDAAYFEAQRIALH